MKLEEVAVLSILTKTWCQKRLAELDLVGPTPSHTQGFQPTLCMQEGVWSASPWAAHTAQGSWGFALSLLT